MPHTPRALIADDNYYNRDLCLLALDNIGFSSIQAENGQEAIDLLTKQSFDLLLLDLSMPVLDGASVIKMVKNMGLRDRLIIVVLTAHSHLANEVESEADFVMYKPIDIQLFAQFLRRLKLK